MIIIRSKQSAPELEQRLLQILKREHICAESFFLTSRSCICCGALTIDGSTQQVLCRGRSLFLTKTEFSLLLFFSQNIGAVLSKEELLRAVWGSQSADTPKVVANTVSNLRKKLGPEASGYIHTAHGGYIFVPEQSEH